MPPSLATAPRDLNTSALCICIVCLFPAVLLYPAITNLLLLKHARTVIAFATDPLAHVEKKAPVTLAIMITIVFHVLS